jgi:adenylylsulfate kinase
MSSDARPSSAHVFWLFGLSGAGKSTLGAGLANALRTNGTPVLVLDGDTLRKGLCAGLGYSDEDRAENLRRAAETAKLALGSGLNVVASFITPLQSHRDLVAGVIGRDRLSLIYLDASIEVCRKRDAKGLYARATSGQVQQMTGVSSGFEAPTASDLLIHTGADDVAASMAQILTFAQSRLPGTNFDR